MPEIVLKDKLANIIREQAFQKGYTDPETYLMDLVIADSEAVVFDTQEIKEGIKRAFKQAIKGHYMSREEFDRRLAEDNE